MFDDSTVGMICVFLMLCYRYDLCPFRLANVVLCYSLQVIHTMPSDMLDIDTKIMKRHRTVCKPLYFSGLLYTVEHELCT